MQQVVISVKDYRKPITSDSDRSSGSTYTSEGNSGPSNDGSTMGSPCCTPDSELIVPRECSSEGC